jgi:ribonuclease R
MKKKGRKSSTYEDLQILVKEILNDKHYRKVSHKQIIRKLGVKDKKTKNIIKNILSESSRGSQTTGGIGGKGKKEIVGKVDYVNPRFAYIISDELEEDVKVKSENLMYAFDDDEVKVQIFRSSRGNRMEGRVVEIVNRYRKEFVGRVDFSGNYAFVVPDFRKMYFDIFVPPSKLNEAKPDDKVVVEIVQWPSRGKNRRVK